MERTYAETMRAAAAAAKEVAPTLSPYGAATAAAFAEAISTARGLGDAALASATAVAGLAARSIAQQMGVEAANVIPILGAVVQLGFAMADASAGGIGPNANDREARRAWCRAEYADPQGTGPNLEVMPADLFAWDGSLNAFRERGRSTVGSVLVALTESDHQEVIRNIRRMSSKTALESMGARLGLVEERRRGLLERATEGGSSDLTDARRTAGWAFDSRVGIPPARRDVYRRIREGIEVQWKRGDGGKSLWPIYLEMLSQDLESGRLPDELARLLLRRDDGPYFPIGEDVAERGERTCFDNDPRALYQVLDLARGYAQTLRPHYGGVQRFRRSFTRRILAEVRRRSIREGLSTRRSLARSATAVGAVIVGVAAVVPGETIVAARIAAGLLGRRGPGS